MNVRSAESPSWVLRDGLLSSPLLDLLGVINGFTTRELGSMAGSIFPLDEQARNRDALAARLGFPGVVRLRQVHGAAVVRVDGPGGTSPRADAMWTDRAGVLLGIAAADCVAVLVADGQGRLGAAHAGWQGTSLGIARALVEILVASGAKRECLVAALRPSIGPCCYTIEEQRAAVITERLGAEAIDRQNGRFVFDLWRANDEQLRAAGVGTVEMSGICTRHSGADVWSYRGRGRDGRWGSALAVLGRRV